MTTQSLNLSEWPFWAPLALTAIGVVLFAMGRYWSRAWAVLFGLTITGVLAGTVWASLNGLWLPESGASIGREVDFLFHVILVLTAFFFLLTEGIFLWTLWNHVPANGQSPKPIHGDHRMELVWTIIPGILLAVIAILQMPTWARMKGSGNESWLSSRYDPNGDKADLLIAVHGRQWEWRIRYHDPALSQPTRPMEWAAKPEKSDLHAINEIHAWPGAKVRLFLRTNDVIHSFFVPQLRIKQDMLPGRTVPTWFVPAPADPTRENRWEIACAELCGGNHYRMRGMVVIHPDKASFEAWYAASASEQSRRDRAAAAATPAANKAS